MKATTRTIGAVLLCLCGATFPQQSPAAAIVVGTYYEDNANYSCTSVAICTVSFSPVAGAPVLLTHVACGVGVSGSPDLLRTVLSVRNSNGTLSRYQELTPSGATEDAGIKYYSVNAASPLLYGATQRPVIAIQLSAAGNVSGQCQVIGEVQS